jgi:hypothetical protein
MQILDWHKECERKQTFYWRENNQTKDKNKKPKKTGQEPLQQL